MDRLAVVIAYSYLQDQGPSAISFSSQLHVRCNARRRSGRNETHSATAESYSTESSGPTRRFRFFHHLLQLIQRGYFLHSAFRLDEDSHFFHLFQFHLLNHLLLLRSFDYTERIHRFRSCSFGTSSGSIGVGKLVRDFLQQLGSSNSSMIASQWGVESSRARFRKVSRRCDGWLDWKQRKAEVNFGCNFVNCARKTNQWHQDWHD